MRNIFAVAGILGGLLWVGLAFFPPKWGPPGTVAYVGYKLWNRLWTPALLGMLAGFSGFFVMVRPYLAGIASAGFIALFVGFALMVIGNVAEFWIFTDLPYEGEGSLTRSIAWMTFLLGMLLMLITSAVTGLVMPGAALVPRWLRMLFMLALPLTVAIAFLNMGLSGLPTGVLSIIVGSFVLFFSSSTSAYRTESGTS